MIHRLGELVHLSNSVLDFLGIENRVKDLRLFSGRKGRDGWTGATRFDRRMINRLWSHGGGEQGMRNFGGHVFLQ
jgi:hypothetical protein